MNFFFTEKKLQATDDLRSYAEKKIGKLERYFRGESDAYVTFSIERGRHKAEVTVKNNGMFFRVSETTNDMYASIDSAAAAIERQIRKHKTRLEKRLKDNAFDKEAFPSFDDSASDTEDTFDVVRTKRFSLKPMTVDEAILQMEMLNHQFFAFRNLDFGGEFSVVYKRNNGGYGLIENVED